MPRSLAPEHEKMLWDKKELNMETSRGLSRTVIFYLIKCFAIWQGKELRHLDTSHVTFGEDDLGYYVALELQKEKKNKKRYDDPANPRSVYKILKKYRSYVANEGPFLVRPITSIKDYICYSPLPLGVNVIERAVSLLTKDAGICPVYDNYSLNLQAVDTLLRFGTGSHCLASWLYKNGLKGMPEAPCCGPTNCEDSNPEISLMISRLLDAPYPLDAVDIIQKMELEEEEPKSFDSWMTNLMSRKMKDYERQNQAKKRKGLKNSDRTELAFCAKKSETSKRSRNKNSKKSPDPSPCQGSNVKPSISSSISKGDDSTLKISSVSSISEGAFSMQVDEAQQVETNPSITTKKKRKNAPYASNQTLAVKKLKPNSEYVKDVPADKGGVGDRGRNDSGIRNCVLKEKTCEKDVNESCGLVLVEVKKEVVEEDLLEVESSKQAQIFPGLLDKTQTLTNHKISSCNGGDGDNIETDRTVTVAAVEPINMCDQRSQKLAAISNNANCGASLNTPANLSEEFKHPCTLSGGKMGLQKTQKDNNSVLQDQINDFCINGRNEENMSESGETVVKAVSKQSEEHLSTIENENENPPICKEMETENSEEEDENSGEDESEFMIDLSPPVLSPQYPISSSEDAKDRMEDDDDEDIGNEERKDYYEESGEYPFNSRGSDKVTSKSSSDIIRFLDNAHRQIKDLLSKSTKNSTSEDQNEPNSSSAESSKIPHNADKNLGKGLSNLHENDSRPKKLTSLSVTSDVNEKNPTFGDSETPTFQASSPTNILQGQQQCSLLRSYLEKPINFKTVSLSSSSSSTSLQIFSSPPSSMSKSKMQTSLLPKAKLDSSLTNGHCHQSSDSSRRVEVCNKNRTSHLSDVQEGEQNSSSKILHTDDLIPSTFSSSQLPVKVVLHNVSSSSTSPLSSNFPMTLNLNSTPPSETVVSSSKHFSLTSSSSSSTSSSLSNTCISSSLLVHDCSSSSSSSSPHLSQLSQPSTSNTTTTTTVSSPNTATFHAKQDLGLKTLFQSLEVVRPDSQGGPQTYNFADIPNLTGPPPNSSHRAERIQTSEINLGDYFPPGTQIPASSIHVVTQLGQNGTEVVITFGYDRNGQS